MQYVAELVGFDADARVLAGAVLRSAGFTLPEAKPGVQAVLRPQHALSLLLIDVSTLAGQRAAATHQFGQDHPVPYVMLCGVPHRGSGVEDALKTDADDILLEGWTEENLRLRVAIAWRQLARQPAPDPPKPVKRGDAMASVRSAYAAELGVDGEWTQPASILVADRDKDVRAMFRHVLEKQGLVVLEAWTGQEAVLCAVRTNPSVILVACDLPVMNGIDATRYLRTDPVCHDTPIVILSASTDRSDIKAGLKAGADDYVSKPIMPDEFLLRVQSWIRLHQRRAALLDSHEMRGEQTRALVCLLDFSSAIVSAGTVDEVLSRTLAVTAEVTCCHRVSLLLPDEHTGRLVIRDSIGLDPDYVASMSCAAGDMTIGRVYSQGRTVVANEQIDSVQLAEDGEREMLTGVPWLVAPLTASHRAVGVLTVSGRWGAAPFTPAELGYIALITNNAGAAISEIETSRTRDEARNSIVLALAKLAEHRDNETGRHVERVTRFAKILAESLRFDPDTGEALDELYVRDLERAVALHDIGKVAIPDHILRKPGKFTREEFQAIKRHTIVGAETIRSVRQRVRGVRFLEMAEEIAGGHHEWFDGSGYPAGLAGKDIPLAARIAALADVYDALTNKRVYKEPYSHDKSRDMIVRARGRHFDPDVVEAFLREEEAFRSLAIELADTTVEEGDTSISVDLVVGQSV